LGGPVFKMVVINFVKQIRILSDVEALKEKKKLSLRKKLNFGNENLKQIIFGCRSVDGFFTSK
jgi:hypothetical protein